MKQTIYTLLILLSTICFSQDGNYILVLDGDSIALDLNSPIEYKLKGKKVNINLVQPDMLTYQDGMIQFKYNKNLNVSNSEIEQGIEQCMVVRSTGNGFMIQKYFDMNPSSLNSFVMNELTKESVSYGYDMKQENVEYLLTSGEKLTGVQAKLTYKGAVETYTVVSYGEKDEGIIVVTMMLDDYYSEDQKMIDLFLETLEIK